MGKSIKDLPVLAIDSFQHMFLFPGDLHKALADPSHIQQFLADLISEKLHRQFHGLPEPEAQPVSTNCQLWSHYYLTKGLVVSDCYYSLRNAINFHKILFRFRILPQSLL